MNFLTNWGPVSVSWRTLLLGSSQMFLSLPILSLSLLQYYSPTQTLTTSAVLLCFSVWSSSTCLPGYVYFVFFVPSGYLITLLLHSFISYGPLLSYSLIASLSLVFNCLYTLTCVNSESESSVHFLRMHCEQCINWMYFMSHLLHHICKIIQWHIPEDMNF